MSYFTDPTFYAVLLGLLGGVSIIAYALGKHRGWSEGYHHASSNVRINIGNEIAIRGSFTIGGTRYKAIPIHKT